ncbi:MAG TPA: hypothetical protein VHT73_09835 [Thermodesulfobacteriota bacterium]|nr:hypothetical protein [Thermodesulfobacteriota bacterium]
MGRIKQRAKKSKNSSPKKKIKPKDSDLEGQEEYFERWFFTVFARMDPNGPIKQLAGPFNPFLDEAKAEIFKEALSLFYRFAIACNNPLTVKVGSKEQIEKYIRSREEQIEEIKSLCVKLMPERPKGRMKPQEIREFRANPESLVLFVEALKLQLGNYRTKHKKPQSYKGSKIPKEEDLVRGFWEETFKTPYPKKIYVDDRTDTTIALSIVAYKDGYRYKDVYDIYHNVSDARRQKIFQDFLNS